MAGVEEGSKPVLEMVSLTLKTLMCIWQKMKSKASASSFGKYAV